MIEEPMPETYFVTTDDVCSGEPEEGCVGCGREIGDTHTLECDCRLKQVWVRFVINYPILVPASWTEADVLHARNEDESFCNAEAIDEIAAISFGHEEDCSAAVDLCAFSWFEIDDKPPVPRRSLLRRLTGR